MASATGDKIVICCSKASLSSYWVDREISIALEKEEQLFKERQEKVLTILPLDLDGYVKSPECQSSHASEIRRRSVGDFNGWNGENGNAIFEREIEFLIKAMRTDGGKEAPPPSKLLGKSSLPSTWIYNQASTITSKRLHSRYNHGQNFNL